VSIEIRSLSGESRDFVRLRHKEQVDLPVGPVKRFVFQPGWGWSEHVRDAVGDRVAHRQTPHLLRLRPD